MVQLVGQMEVAVIRNLNIRVMRGDMFTQYLLSFIFKSFDDVIRYVFVWCVLF